MVVVVGGNILDHHQRKKNDCNSHDRLHLLYAVAPPFIEMSRLALEPAELGMLIVAETIGAVSRWVGSVVGRVNLF